jgi:serine protease Do
MMACIKMGKEREVSSMKVNMLMPVLTTFLAVCLFTSAWADPPQVKQVAEKPVILFKEGTNGKASFLKTIKARFEEPNGKIGELQKGWFCGKTGDIVWSKKLYNAISPKLGKAFKEELEAAHFPTNKMSDAIFDTPKEDVKPASDLHVGMLIKDVAANFCVKSSELQGGVYMKIFWQVYSPEAQKVVFETTTEGSFQPEGLIKSNMDLFFLNAFRSATRNLLSEQGFYNAVTSSEVIKARTDGPKTLKFERVKLLAEPLTKNITKLRTAVATIVSDRGSGSGFFVNKDGYLLTNQHVVGSSKFVKVKLSTGRDLIGEVTRSDKARDIALIKTEQIAVQPMGIRDSEPNIGEEVYVLGSPLGDKFNTTLTKGILSGYRTMNEQRYLQSDASILPGDSGGPLLDAEGAVIGITVAGLGAKGMAGMNFFIPIGDALAKLGVEFN